VIKDFDAKFKNFTTVRSIQASRRP